MTTINAHTPAAEPIVFARDGQACVNTRDLAAFAGRDHRTAVRSLERALQRQPHLLGKWVFEALYRDDRGRPAVSYDLTDDGFCVFGCYVLGRRAIKRSFPYFEALISKKAELRAAEDALPRTLSDLQQALRTGADFNDLNMWAAIACIWMNEASSALDKALELKKRNDALTQDNGHLTLEKAELAGQLQELQSALGEAVSPSLFRN
jgi:tetratricopeptide (TPR) repeat protein